MNYELELRGKVSETAFFSVKKKLEQEAESIKNNNKLSQFFVFPRGILKVSTHEADGRVVLSVKLGDEASSNLDERETELVPGSYQSVVRMLIGMGYTPKEEVRQIRTDYAINGCTISLKYTDTWGYHFEAEKMIDNQIDDADAREQLHSLCSRYGLTPMDSDELKRFLATL